MVVFMFCSYRHRSRNGTAETGELRADMWHYRGGRDDPGRAYMYSGMIPRYRYSCKRKYNDSNSQGVGKKMAISAGEGIVSEGDQSEQNNRGKI